MTVQRITEQVSSRALEGVSDSDIDEANGVIRNVVICGLKSANGREYPRSVLERDYAKYEGVRVNFDHSMKSDRPFDDGAGWLSDVKPGADGRPRGTLNLYTTDKRTPKVFEAARKNPNGLGLSHVAMCQTTRKQGVEVVESINSVESVDIVGRPATVKGLFESHSGNPAMKISLKQFVEQCGPKWGPKRWGMWTKLVEDIGDMADTPTMDAPAETAGADANPEDLKSALMAALSPILDDAFDSGNSDKAVSALKDFIKLHAKHSGGEGGGDSDSKPTDSPPMESRKLADPWAVLKECRKAGFEPTDTQLELLAAQPDATKRQAFITESKAQLDAAKKTTESRPTSGRRTTESTTAPEAKPAATPEEFLARVMGK